MFKKKYTAWIPLGNFSHGDSDYITFVRKNLKTGMLHFKTKQVNGFFGSHNSIRSVLPNKLIDVQRAWDQILKMEQYD